MSAPLYSVDALGPAVSLLAALAIGIAFGFFLERAGLGDGRKLTGQFYLRDLTVLKVMFTAIVTAMVGVFVLSYWGAIDLRFIAVNQTYLLPQLAGGLLFGIGFVLGGYCPGTSCVAATSGRLDGIVVFLGMLTGVWLFGELFAVLRPFYYATPLGPMTLPELTGLPPLIIVVGVLVLALAAFAFAERIEKRATRRSDRAPDQTHHTVLTVPEERLLAS